MNTLLDLFGVDDNRVSFQLYNLYPSGFNRDLMDNLSDDLFSDELFYLRKDLFYLFFVDLNLDYFLYLNWDLLYLIHYASDWHCSVCLHFNCDFFVMNQMFRSADVFNLRSVDDLVDWDCHNLIDYFVNNLIFLQIDSLGDFNSL